MSDLRAALADLQSGRLDRAAATCAGVLAKEPGNADALALMAYLQGQRGNTSEALATIDRAVAVRPGDSALHFNRATLREAAGDPRGAASDYAEACRIDPGNVAAQINLGRLHLRDDRLADAERCFAAAAAATPTLPQAHEGLGIALQRQNRSAEAAAALHRALTLAPGNPEIEANLGWVMLESGQPQQAVEHLRRVVAAQPGVAALWNSLGGALMCAGQWQEALTAVDRALALAPSHTHALAFKAMMLGELGRREEARALVDPATFLFKRQLTAPPSGYASMTAFHGALLAHILSHPSLMADRPDNITRHGAQTGDLLGDDPGPVALLAEPIAAAVEAYLARMPAAGGLFAAALRPRRWRLRARATVLRSSGYQASHNHPDSWISGVYYVAIPPEVGTEPGQPAGWIEFGKPDPFFGTTAPTDLEMVRPEEGLMMLFPSHLWHRTVPFIGEQPRVSIAFDLLPLG